jgi:16S rRNA (cytosine967-C5)-methyltransferase
MAALPTKNARRWRRPRKVTPGRWVAWNVVRRTFDEDAYTDRALAGEAEREQLDGRDRAFAQRLSYGVVQRARRIDFVIGTVGKRPLGKIDPPVLHALRMGVYELLEMAGSEPHAAVDQAVELVRGTVGERAVAFTNAVLRRSQVDGAAILAGLDPADDDDLATQLSFPAWMVQRLRASFGEDGVAALAAQNADTTRSIAFRINTLHPDASSADGLLAESGATLVPAPAVLGAALPDARLVQGSTAALEPLVERGVLLPQSLSSQLVAMAVDPAPDQRVLDMCAAPGGKTTHLAARMENTGSILACDLHQSRAASVSALATRCHATNVEVRRADATELDRAEVGTFDLVLLDAPCSGLGVLDRRPDTRWKRTEDAVTELVELQGRLLARAAQLVRPGGAIVYSTCTLLREENEHIVTAALADPGLALEPDPLPAAVPGELRLPDALHMARVWPHRHDSDGFFLARLRRTGDAPAEPAPEQPAPTAATTPEDAA